MSTNGIDTVRAKPQNEGMAENKRDRTFIMLSCTPEFKDEVAKVAAAEGLTSSSLIRRLLTLHMRAVAED